MLFRPKAESTRLGHGSKRAGCSTRRKGNPLMSNLNNIRRRDVCRAIEKTPPEFIVGTRSIEAELVAAVIEVPHAEGDLEGSLGHDASEGSRVPPRVMVSEDVGGKQTACWGSQLVNYCARTCYHAVAENWLSGQVARSPHIVQPSSHAGNTPGFSRAEKISLAVLGTRPFVLRKYVYVDALGRLDTVIKINGFELRKYKIRKVSVFPTASGFGDEQCRVYTELSSPLEAENACRKGGSRCRGTRVSTVHALLHCCILGPDSEPPPQGRRYLWPPRSPDAYQCSQPDACIPGIPKTLQANIGVDDFLIQAVADSFPLLIDRRIGPVSSAPAVDETFNTRARARIRSHSFHEIPAWEFAARDPGHRRSLRTKSCDTCRLKTVPVTLICGRGGVQQLASSPPTKVNRVHLPAGSLPDLRTWESCRTMSLVGGFPRSLQFPPLLYSGAAPLHLISQNLDRESQTQTDLLPVTEFRPRTLLVALTPVYYRPSGHVHVPPSSCRPSRAHPSAQLILYLSGRPGIECPAKPITSVSTTCALSRALDTHENTSRRRGRAIIAADVAYLV
ncbi:hypothetical protein PR048_006439 [Dryococelus australis]|uniref:Uncharacterized protein n=1 Tax=Dryococelus australis TaxID=614101 RepID=A0ABQ9IAZ4_9NEOP|nr:hypothetical protein PR048_006439 [Dryococelus australis]